MATSGSFLTSDSGQGSSLYYGRTIFEWWRTGWGRTSTQGYHHISYHLKTYGGSASYWQNFYNGSMNVDGTGYTFGSPIKAYGAGATTLGSGSKTLYTNSAGNRSFGASAQGGIYYASINTSGAGSWDLDNIPMYGTITGLSPDSGFTDETPSVVVDITKYAGQAHLWFRFDGINSGDSTHHKVNVSDPYVWSGFSSWVQSTLKNTNSATLYIHYGDDLDSNGSVDRWNNAVTRTITIKNDAGQANPTFTNFTYLDTNATTVGVTGSNQVLIQGKSTLSATVSTANKATPNKSATMSTYLFTIGGYSQSSAYSSSTNVTKAIGTVSDVTGVQTLSVKAIDSRSNSKTVSKSVTILPYASPAFVPTLAVAYTNGYDVSGGITVTADGSKIATISPMTLSGTDKNAVNGTSGVKFDVSKSNNTSYTGTWVNVATTQTAGTGAINSTLTTIATNILNKMSGLTHDNTVRWYIKFSITDKLETKYYETYIDIGKPIFRIGYDGYVYNKEVKLLTANDPISIFDTRSAATTTDVGDKQIRWDFKSNSTDGLNDGGTFHAVQTIQQWNDSSGGSTRQLAFTDNGGMWHRHATIGGTWGTWYPVGPRNPYRFFAYHAGTTTITSGGDRVIIFNNEKYDTSSHYNTSTGKYTAPVTGYYQFDTVVTFRDGAANEVGYIMLYVNGSYYQRGQRYQTATTNEYPCVTMSILAYVAAGQAVEVRAFVQANRNLETGNSYFCGHFVSSA